MIIETKAGKLYATGATGATNSFVEIGYYDEEDNMIPIAAVEVKTKELGEDVDEKAIWRTIYDPEDSDDYEQVMIKKGESKNVRQFAIDILDDVDERKIKEALEKAEIVCLGCEWKATWTEEGYDTGKPPVSSD